MTVLLGSLWCSIKHFEAPYVFDWEHGIALHPMQGTRDLIPAKEDVSWDFSICSENLGYNHKLQRRWPIETKLGSAKSGLLSLGWTPQEAKLGLAGKYRRFFT